MIDTVGGAGGKLRISTTAYATMASQPPRDVNLRGGRYNRTQKTQTQNRNVVNNKNSRSHTQVPETTMIEIIHDGDIH